MRGFEAVGVSYPGFAARPRRAGGGAGVIVAIDGPAGAGKSTVARAVARRLGAGLPRHRGDVPRRSPGSRSSGTSHPGRRRPWPPWRATSRSAIEPTDDGDRVRVDGQDVTEAIRAPRGQRPGVGGLGPSGRAGGDGRRPARAAVERRRGCPTAATSARVVWPGADLKVFLTASRSRSAPAAGAPSWRPAASRSTSRRCSRTCAAATTCDTTRATSPLRVAPGAIVIDSSEMDGRRGGRARRAPGRGPCGRRARDRPRRRPRGSPGPGGWPGTPCWCPTSAGRCACASPAGRTSPPRARCSW